MATRSTLETPGISFFVGSSAYHEVLRITDDPDQQSDLARRLAQISWFAKRVHTSVDMSCGALWSLTMSPVSLPRQKRVI